MYRSDVLRKESQVLRVAGSTAEINKAVCW